MSAYWTSYEFTGEKKKKKKIKKIKTKGLFLSRSLQGVIPSASPSPFCESNRITGYFFLLFWFFLVKKNNLKFKIGICCSFQRRFAAEGTAASPRKSRFRHRIYGESRNSGRGKGRGRSQPWIHAYERRDVDPRLAGVRGTPNYSGNNGTGCSVRK